MEYPLISEYRDAIISAEDNFNELSSLRPVLDDYGNPVMSSGNFAAVFKMKDKNDGKLYAVKCFIKDQEGRAESYQKIADELETVSSSYIVPLRYLEKELFVDTAHCQEEEFPIVVMEWVEGETLDAYLTRNLQDKYELEMLSYRFNRMAGWLLAQSFAHGDLKPDNILVRKDGSLVLVDYDGMFVPSMKGENAREMGSPDYRHPLRNDTDFNEHIDDFAISVIALSLKAISLKPALIGTSTISNTLLFSQTDYRNSSRSSIVKEIVRIEGDPDLGALIGTFFIVLARNSLDLVSFRIFMTAKPKRPNKLRKKHEEINTEVTEQDLREGIPDEFGGVYSKDGKKFLKFNGVIKNYNLRNGCEVICDKAFASCSALQSVHISDTVTSIGKEAFSWCNFLQSVQIPNLLTSIGDRAFSGCSSLQHLHFPDTVSFIGINPFIDCKNLTITLSSTSQLRLIDGLLIGINGELISCLNHSISIVIPNSVTTIGDKAFCGCSSLLRVHIPVSVTTIGNFAFQDCSSLQSMLIPASVTSIGDYAFSDCSSLHRVEIPDSVTMIGRYVFLRCKSLRGLNIPASITSIEYGTFAYCYSLRSILMPNSIISIGAFAFHMCEALQSVYIPDSVTNLGCGAFDGCKSLSRVHIPDSVTINGSWAFPKKCEVIHRK